jgi:CRISPR-associated protein Csb3
MAPIQVDVDIANPGQFFACCGLLELADRLWQGAEGWFNAIGNEFFLRPLGDAENADDLVEALSQCDLNNTMSREDRTRYEELGELKTNDLSTAMQAEKKALDKLERELPLVFGPPFSVQIDWYNDNRSGGSRFKTWAGQQSVIKIGQAMKQPLEKGKFKKVPQAEWLDHTCCHDVPFYFDAAIGAHSSVLDVGFSTDTTKMSTGVRALLELAAFVGLQRFRPHRPTKANHHIYSTWTEPASPQTAAVAASGFLSFPNARVFAFPLMFRTKYLKSFLPAQPLTR